MLESSLEIRRRFAAGEDVDGGFGGGEGDEGGSSFSRRSMVMSAPSVSRSISRSLAVRPSPSVSSSLSASLFPSFKRVSSMISSS